MPLLLLLLLLRFVPPIHCRRDLLQPRSVLLHRLHPGRPSLPRLLGRVLSGVGLPQRLQQHLHLAGTALQQLPAAQHPPPGGLHAEGRTFAAQGAGAAACRHASRDALDGGGSLPPSGDRGSDAVPRRVASRVPLHRQGSGRVQLPALLDGPTRTEGSPMLLDPDGGLDPSDLLPGPPDLHQALDTQSGEALLHENRQHPLALQNASRPSLKPDGRFRHLRQTLGLQPPPLPLGQPDVVQALDAQGCALPSGVLGSRPPSDLRSPGPALQPRRRGRL
mmetsp:Transcript_132947/g.425201  ORF Transcript_132947/g.425201 Transcript_132947/m.425201 type:complete len:277 (-) Transcript_132947:2825-3655(-)